ncbi:hypothetical protein [Aquimarina sediminis]|uniref:hypothetical protein n=1 Tax=Aquimarina sediminis TaxID=2070536 RepID=UPI000CA0732F|nr:hypothetical protein [Aquimarina sediminis]
MRTQNGQETCTCLKSKAGKTAISQPLTDEEKEFLSYVKFHGLDSFIRSLKLIHDISLYHSDYLIDEHEKVALHDVKILWERFEGLDKA